MCGIAGLWDRAARAPASLRPTAQAMIDALAHRGPDGDGLWMDAGAGVALGHRRLSIIDLSPAGAQPMHSADGRWVITYNGELYNTAEVARDLAGVAFRGHSDTEVVVEAVARWGVEAALQRCAGMFALALWDRQERVLWLARDRLGIKPLYVGEAGDGRLLFGSELKALMACDALPRRVAPAALAALLHYGCVPAGASILAGVEALRPGHLMRLDGDGGRRTWPWWSLRDVACRASRFTGGADAATEALDALLAEVVGAHLVSDVPLGAFLSGGIDSSLVVSHMARAARGPVRTFSIGFSEDRFNEAGHARAVAGHLGTEHQELIVSPSDALSVIPRLPTLYDEPFADVSQINMALVSALARREVTVALSGDGGDEGFAGYSRHAGLARLWRRVGPLPRPLRQAAAGALTALSPAVWDGLGRLLPARRRPNFLGDKAHKVAGSLTEPSLEAMYARVRTHWHPAADLIDGAAAIGSGADPTLARDLPDPVDRLRYLDMAAYLPDDILTKVDRASMAVGLEARVPLLDHRVIEFAWRLPPSLLIEGGRGKMPLRRVLARAVPPELSERPKMGFGVPIGDWLRDPLRAWAEDLLAPESLADTGLFRADPIRRCWHDHIRGRRSAPHALWPVLMAQAWARHWRASL